jgi:GAF domain-containing protein
MSAQLKAALRSAAQSGNSPFEKFEHFIVAPPAQTGPVPRGLGPPRPGNTQSRIISSFDLKSQGSELTDDPSGPRPSRYTARVDKFLIDAFERSVWEAAEILFTNLFEATSALWWTDIPSLGVLYCESHEIIAKYSEGLAGACYLGRSVIRTTEPTAHSGYNAAVDSAIVSADVPIIAFPLFNFQSKVVAVMVVTRGSPFTREDLSVITMFQRQFQILSRWLLNQPVQEPIMLDILRLQKTEDLREMAIGMLQNFYICRACEVWAMDPVKRKVTKHVEKESVEVRLSDAGIVGKVLLNQESLNLRSNKEHEGYLPAVDGAVEEAMIAVPVAPPGSRFMYAVVLRGPKGRKIFNGDDEDSLKKLAPSVALGFANAAAFSTVLGQFEQSSQEKEGLAALIDVAEVLSGQLDTERLCEIIMEKGRFLTKADRCSLFLVSPKRDHLITSLHKGLKHCIDISITKGIVGRTVTEAKAQIINDAYEDPSFDPATDLQTGYRTKSILSVPIFTQRGEVMGVTEMINKENGAAFTKWDTSMIQIFNVFCGISLENSRLYKQSLEMSAHLRAFFGISNALARADADCHKALTDVVRHARRALDSRRASVFLIDERSSIFTPYVVDGGKLPSTLPLDRGIIGRAFRRREVIVSNNAPEDPDFNSAIDEGTGFKTVSLCAAPIITANDRVMGVIEMVNKIHGGYRPKDQKLLATISTFVALVLVNSNLRGIAVSNSTDLELPLS